MTTTKEIFMSLVKQKERREKPIKWDEIPDDARIDDYPQIAEFLVKPANRLIKKPYTFDLHCKICDYKWRERLRDFIDRGCVCPLCLGEFPFKGNGLSDLRPDLKKLFSDERNDFDFEKIHPDSDVWIAWKCEKGSWHYWRETAQQIVQHDYPICPYCRDYYAEYGPDSFEERYPEYVKYLVDGSPWGLRYDSQERQWWECPKCGCLVYAKIDEFVSGKYKCLVCENNKESTGIGLGKTLELIGEDKIRSSILEDYYKDEIRHSYHRQCASCGKKTAFHFQQILIGDVECAECKERKALSKKSIAALYPEKAKYWHAENADTPQDHLPTETVEKFWYCPACWNKVVAPIDRFVRGEYYCKNCRSLAMTDPAHAYFWHSDNPDSPREHTRNSMATRNWHCPQCNEKIAVPIRRFVEGRYFCRWCESLAGTDPELASLWAESNSDSAYDHKRDEIARKDWHCPECNSLLKNVPIAKFVEGKYTCSKCNSLAMTDPWIFAYWSEENSTTPWDHTRASQASRRFKCPDCGGLLTDKVCDFVKGIYTCKSCKRDAMSLESKYPDLMLEWDSVANYALGIDPSNVSPNSQLNAMWECPEGHHYSMVIKERVGFYEVSETACKKCRGVRTKTAHFIKKI